MARLPLVSMALLSAATLAYELLLMRLLSIVQWHHFAYMIISLALLGYGASGTFVALFYQRLTQRFAFHYSLLIGLFAVSSLACFALAQALPFHPEALLWDSRQPLWLLALYLILAVPFFFAATAIALALSFFKDNVGRLYAADLLGAGLGSLGLIALLFFLMPLDALLAVACVALVAVILAAAETRSTAAWKVALLAVLLGGGSALLTARVELAVSPYKPLPQTLLVAGTRISAEHSSPLGLLSVVQSDVVPLRHAPGLSLTASSGPPGQIGIFTDASNMSVINDARGGQQDFAYLQRMTSAIGYHLASPEHVLVLGAGGGADVWQALHHGAAKVTAVEINPQLIAIVRDDFAAYSGRLYGRDDVALHVDEARGFVTGSKDRYDLIQVAMLDAFAASASGLYSLNESYLYTVEALETYLSRLSESGMLSISRWVKLPPRDSLKLFATAISALQSQGVENPATQLVMIRSWQTSTLLISKRPFLATDIDRLKQFCRKNGFDVVWYPGIQASEANRYNRLKSAYFYQAVSALLDERQRDDFIERYKYRLQPASDDRPYFFHFFKWSVLPELLAIQSGAGLPLMEWGYLILFATLIQALLASVVLIILPLLLRRGGDRKIAHGGISRWRVLLYFVSIGLGFLFIEIAFIQKFILLLHHPLYAASVVITGFLLFAALGSLWSQRLADRGGQTGIKWVVAGIALCSLSILGFFAFLPDTVLALDLIYKIPLTLALIAPLAFLMGMPFPLALASLAQQAENLIPWAWGVNGCASVISAVLATLLAIQFGFNVVVLLAIGLYATALFSFPHGRIKPE